MSQEPTLDPAVEARFQALAACVDEDTWTKLISGTTDMVLRRLAGVGLITDADPDLLLQGREHLGRLLVEFTNVVLTCVAQGEAGTSREAGA